MRPARRIVAISVAARGRACIAHEQTDARSDKSDPWRVPVLVAQIPDTGLHRDIEADPGRRARRWRRSRVCARFSRRGFARCDAQSGGRFHVTGQVRARVGQTCVVTLDPIENDIDEEVDLIFAPPEQIPDLADLSTRPMRATSRFRTRRSRSRTALSILAGSRPTRCFWRSIPIRANRRGVRAQVDGRRSRGSSVCRAESAAA